MRDAEFRRVYSRICVMVDKMSVVEYFLVHL